MMTRTIHRSPGHDWPMRVRPTRGGAIGVVVVVVVIVRGRTTTEMESCVPPPPRPGCDCGACGVRARVVVGGVHDACLRPRSRVDDDDDDDLRGGDAIVARVRVACGA